MRLKLYILLCIITVSLTSCMGDMGDVHVVDIPHMKWNKSEPIYVYKKIEDTTSLTQISLIIHHSNSFKYDKLVMAIEVLSPENSFCVDTVSINLGKKGDSNYSDTKVSYRTSVRFNQKGVYRFRLSQIMEDSVLSGIAGVGVEFR